MSASKEFRTATLNVLRMIITNPEFKIKRTENKTDGNVVATNKKGNMFTQKRNLIFVRYALLSKDNKTVLSIKSQKSLSGPIVLTIDGKVLDGEFLDSELKALYKSVEKEYKKRNTNYMITKGQNKR